MCKILKHRPKNQPKLDITRDGSVGAIQKYTKTDRKIQNPCEIEIRSFKLPSRFIWAMIYSYLIYLACIAQFINQVTWTEEATASTSNNEHCGIQPRRKTEKWMRKSERDWMRWEILSVQFPMKLMFSWATLATDSHRFSLTSQFAMGDKQSHAHISFTHIHTLYFSLCIVCRFVSSFCLVWWP